MSSFVPFRGVRFDTTKLPIGDVTAPPYDVIDERDRAALVDRDPHNIVQVDLPDEADGPGRYDAAAQRFAGWLAEGSLIRDSEPSFYAYRMDYDDDRGRKAHTLGVLGALELSRPDEGSILPHEHTTPKAKSDRLDLLRASRVNLSAIWGLSLSDGLTALCRLETEPDQHFTDEDGVTHRLWRITDPERLDAISRSVGSSPVVIADGHHRFETSLTYRDERRAADPDDHGADQAMMYVVELIDDELGVRPIHRLLVNAPSGEDLRARLATSFELRDAGPIGSDIIERMDTEGALVLVSPDGTGSFLVPRPGRFEGVDDLDSSRLSAALEDIDGIGVSYQHGVDKVLRALSEGAADFGVLLRPATVSQIEANAHEGRRMPPKTTFFHPKPRTGTVFRVTDE